LPPNELTAKYSKKNERHLVVQVRKNPTAATFQGGVKIYGQYVANSGLRNNYWQYSTLSKESKIELLTYR
jgi:hypothetical protein